MKSDFEKALARANNLDSTLETVIKLLQQTRANKNVKSLGFVSGSVFSDGPEFIKRNITLLTYHTDKLRVKHEFPIFSAVDIFYSGLFEKLPESKLPYLERRNKFFSFWKNVIESGYITDIFMSPGWERSEGAKDEHKRAKENNIKIHYVDHSTRKNVIETVAYVHIKNKKLLLVRNKGKRGFYMAGGKRNGSENDHSALIREVKEEVNVELVSPSMEFLGVYEAQAYGKKKGVNVRIYCYMAKHKGNLAPSSEIAELAFFSRDDYLSKKYTAPAVRLIIEDLNAKGLIE